MKYKLIAIDLDDTLLNNDHYVSKANIEAIKKAQDKGVKIAICTGRPTTSALKIVDQIGIFHEDDYVISYNGAVITTVSGKVIHEFVVNKEELSSLIDLGRAYNIDVQCYSINDFIIEKSTIRSKSYEDLTGMKPIILKDLKTLEHSYKVLFNGESIEELDKLKVDIDNKHIEKLSTFFSKPTFLESVNKECNKGIATKIVADLYNIQREEVIAIGDSYNDIYMIEFAGLGVCVNNGRGDVKKISDYICENTNHEDAIAEVVQKFVL